MKDAPLGQASRYPERYAPELLYPIPRAANRERLELGAGWPWHGEDRWQAFELSWLNPRGLPQVAIGELRIPAVSPFLIESKSLKLYCNSLNQTVFADREAVRTTLANDLGQAAGAPVGVSLTAVDQPITLLGRPAGFQLLDELPVEITRYEPDASLLQASGSAKVQKFCSHLLKSNCPVTGQPDWGSLLIALEGPELNPERLLAYIVGYRNAQDFHEHCVESIFMDLMRQAKPERLTVSAQYTRRGGLDINPWRSTEPGKAPEWRLARQ